MKIKTAFYNFSRIDLPLQKTFTNGFSMIFCGILGAVIAFIWFKDVSFFLILLSLCMCFLFLILYRIHMCISDKVYKFVGEVQYIHNMRHRKLQNIVDRSFIEIQNENGICFKIYMPRMKSLCTGCEVTFYAPLSDFIQNDSNTYTVSSYYYLYVSHHLSDKKKLFQRQ